MITDVLSCADFVGIFDIRVELADVLRLLDVEAEGVPPEGDAAHLALHHEHHEHLEAAESARSFV